MIEQTMRTYNRAANVSTNKQAEFWTDTTDAEEAAVSGRGLLVGGAS